MRRNPTIWRRGSKQVRRTIPKPLPKCREVTVEVMGVAPGIKRIDIVSEPQTPKASS